MKPNELKSRIDSYLEDWDNRLAIHIERETIFEACNWGTARRFIEFASATLITDELAELLGVSSKTVQRYRDRGMPAFWKENPERDGRAQWMYCGQSVLFWCITATLKNEIEMPPEFLRILADWPAWCEILRSKGLTDCKGTLAEYETSGHHFDYMHSVTDGPCPWTADMDPPFTWPETIDYRKKRGSRDSEYE
jgi:hypothetical protein